MKFIITIYTFYPISIFENVLRHNFHCSMTIALLGVQFWADWMNDVFSVCDIVAKTEVLNHNMAVRRVRGPGSILASYTPMDSVPINPILAEKYYMNATQQAILSAMIRMKTSESWGNEYRSMGSFMQQVSIGVDNGFTSYGTFEFHYNDVLMSAMASQITSIMMVYSTVYSGADRRKHQSSASLAFERGIHRWPVNSMHKEPVTQKCFPFDDVIMWKGFMVPNSQQVMRNGYYRVNGIPLRYNAVNFLIITRIRHLMACRLCSLCSLFSIIFNIML